MRAPLVLVLALMFAALACDHSTSPRVSSWTAQITSSGAPVASTLVKITFLDDAPKPVAVAEGSTDASGNITVPLVMNSGATAHQASVWIANRGTTTVPFGATTVEVPSAGSSEPSTAPARLAIP